MAMPVHMDQLAPGSGLGSSGEVRLVPDGDSTIPSLPWHPAHALSMVNMVETSGEPWACCPRAALRRTLQALQERYGLTLQVGFETEFMLLKPSGRNVSSTAAAPKEEGVDALPAQPVEKSTYAHSSAVDAQADVLDSIADALQEMGIEVLQYHAESAPGQYELVTAPYPAMEACDKLLATREAIRGVAWQHEILTTFLPKYQPSAAGNGCHMHFSLLAGEESIMLQADTKSVGGGGDASKAGTEGFPALSQQASAFLAGVLRHLPALLPFTAPSANSYERLRPQCWSGAFQAWGWDNREVPLRMTAPPGGPSAANAEYKALDATANPHVALAAIIAAGMLGLADGLDLPAALQEDPSSLTEKERSDRKLPPLPASLPDALDALTADLGLQVALADALGAPLLQAFLAVRRCEALRFKDGGERELLYLKY